jgi:hypothetical protein
MAMSNQFSELATTTLRKYASLNLANQVFNADPLFAFLFAKGQAGGTYDGGEFISEPLMYKKNDTVSSYSGYDELNNTPQDTAATAVFSPKSYSASITLDGETMRKNSGEAAKINLLKSKIKQAEMSLRDDLSEDSYLDGTGNSSKDITGLAAACSASGTYADISRSTYSWWAAQSDATAVAMDTGWMRTMINDIRGSSAMGAPDMVGVCDLIICSQTLYESFEALLEPHLRVQGATLGALGWETLKFKGAELAFSEYMPAGTCYFISSEYMKVVAHPEANFSTDEFQKPVNQDAQVAHIYWMGELVVNNCRRLGVATNKTA